MRIVVINPTYNERENIQLLIKKLDKVRTKLVSHELLQLVVDDNSPDKTAEIVRSQQKKNPYIHLIQGQKKGLGEAYIRGMKYAMQELKADIVVMMDADLQHDPAILPNMLYYLTKGYDFIIGSRYIKGGTYPKEWGWFRVLNSKVANFLARFIAGITFVKDCTSGYRIIKVQNFLDKVDFENLHAIGYSFQLMLLYEIVKHKAKVYEYPMNFKERFKGESKVGMNSQYMKDIFEFFRNAFIIRFLKMKNVLNSFKNIHKKFVQSK